jgi:hypothetical protein
MASHQVMMSGIVQGVGCGIHRMGYRSRGGCHDACLVLEGGLVLEGSDLLLLLKAGGGLLRDGDAIGGVVVVYVSVARVLLSSSLFEGGKVVGVDAERVGSGG